MPKREDPEYWTGEIGGYIILPDGTPVNVTEEEGIVINRSTGQRGATDGYTFTPLPEK